MYKSIDTNRVSSFPEHFKAPEMSDIPYPGFKDHPNGREILSNEWLQCKEFPSIYIIENSTDFFTAQIVIAGIHYQIPLVILKSI